MLSSLEFAGKIAWMRSELLDLKTAHQRGLGLIDFFSESQEFLAQPLQLYQITIQISESYRDVFPPLFQVAINPVGGTGTWTLSNISVDEETLQINALIGTIWNTQQNVTVQVTSSAKIASLVVEEYNA